MAQPVKQRVEDEPYSPLQDGRRGHKPRHVPARPFVTPGENPAVNRNAHRQQNVEAIMTIAVSAQGVSQHGQRQHDKYDRLVATAQSVPS